MGLPVHPIRPFTNAVHAVAGCQREVAAWAPWALLAVCKAAVLVALARFDLVPPLVWGAVLAILPGLEARVHYPDLPLAMPGLMRRVDLFLFLTVAIWAHAWTIARLARRWGATPARLGIRHALRLVCLAVPLVAIPAAVVAVASPFWGRETAGLAAAACGAFVAAFLFAAPAFVVVHDLDLRRAVRASAGLLLRLPLAVPLAVVAVGLLHAPGLFLRAPAVRAGVAQDPDWILWALLAQLPSQALGAFIAAGISTYYALRTRERRPQERARGLRPATATALVVVVAALGTGCDDRAPALSLRYASERAIERARLRADALKTQASPADSTAWLQVAAMYNRPLQRLDRTRDGAAGSPQLERDLGRLAVRARLGRAAAWSRGGRSQAARADYAAVIAQQEFRGARADAALGLARCEDRARQWDAAFAAYRAWIEGVAAGDWPLHANGLEAPAYVARRLADRGAMIAREDWIECAQRAFALAAARDEQARDARMVRFALLLAAARWDDAFLALRELRAAHDPQGRDGRLLVAEASLLAGGMRRDDAALGVLHGLNAEGSPFDDQHRVAGWLLAGNIHSRRGENRAARDAFESAAGAARSDAGRSEATLGLARICAARGDIEAARRHYSQLRQAWPSTQAGLVAPLEEIRMLRQAGRDDEANALVPVVQRTYRDVIRRFGTEKPALVAARFLGETYGAQGDWDAGVALLDSMFTTFGTDARAGTLLVLAARLAAEKLADEQRAAALLERVTTRFPDSDVAVFARGFADSLTATAAALDGSQPTP